MYIMYIMKYKSLVFVAIAIFTFILISSLTRRNTSQNFDCPYQHFHLHNMNICHPWLSCNDMENIDIVELIGIGAVKAVYHATWKNISIALSKLNNPDYATDFRHGLKMLKLLNPSPYVVQLIGYCESENVIMTEFHKLGNAINITDMVSNLKIDNLQLRLKLCLNYALLLEFLHNGPVGPRVMCDSNSLVKLLSQLLVTDEMTVIVNDLDSVPEINKALNETIKCGHKKLEGNFIAPEQQWPLPDIFDDEKMPGYDEKIDIWKAASVCDHFIDNVSDSEMARYRLFYVHKSCKNINPRERPTATQLAAQYIKIMYELQQEL